MELQFDYHDKAYKADATRSDQTVTVKIGEKSYTAEVCACDDHHMQLKIGQKSYQVAFASRGEERFLSVNGRTHVLKRLSNRRRGGVGMAAAQDLTAPMPGKILQLLVSNGDTVEEGQPLLILEAMKMEHTIKAHKTGTVVGLKLNEGDQVDVGQVLLDVEEAE